MIQRCLASRTSSRSDVSGGRFDNQYLVGSAAPLGHSAGLRPQLAQMLPKPGVGPVSGVGPTTRQGSADLSGAPISLDLILGLVSNRIWSGTLVFRRLAPSSAHSRGRYNGRPPAGSPPKWPPTASLPPDGCPVCPVARSTGAPRRRNVCLSSGCRCHRQSKPQSAGGALLLARPDARRRQARLKSLQGAWATRWCIDCRAACTQSGS